MSNYMIVGVGQESGDYAVLDSRSNELITLKMSYGDCEVTIKKLESRNEVSTEDDWLNTSIDCCSNYSECESCQ